MRNFATVFTENGLDKKPYKIVESPPQQIGSLSPMGQANWQEQPLTIRDRCEDAVFKVKSRIQKRGLYLEPFFRDLDKYGVCYIEIFSFVLLYFKVFFKYLYVHI